MAGAVGLLSPTLREREKLTEWTPREVEHSDLAAVDGYTFSSLKVGTVTFQVSILVEERCRAMRERAGGATLKRPIGGVAHVNELPPRVVPLSFMRVSIDVEM